jgi:hypothetical protein
MVLSLKNMHTQLEDCASQLLVAAVIKRDEEATEAILDVIALLFTEAEQIELAVYMAYNSLDEDGCEWLQEQIELLDCPSAEVNQEDSMRVLEDEGYTIFVTEQALEHTYGKSEYDGETNTILK